MRNLKITLLTVLFAFLSPALATACEAPTKGYITELFDDISQWTEVKSDGSLEISERPPVVRISINFDDVYKSQVDYGKKNPPSIKKLCVIQGGLEIHAGSHKLKVTKTNHGIRSEFRILGLKQVYYYMPTDQVE